MTQILFTWKRVLAYRINLLVIPANAGIQCFFKINLELFVITDHYLFSKERLWILAFTGMTKGYFFVFAYTSGYANIINKSNRSTDHWFCCLVVLVGTTRQVTLEASLLTQPRRKP